MLTTDTCARCGRERVLNWAGICFKCAEEPEVVDAIEALHKRADEVLAKYALERAERALLSHIECKHRRTKLVCGSRWTGDGGSGSYDVRLCLDCGRFFVHGWANEQYYAVDFNLQTAEEAEAAGLHAKYMDAKGEGTG